MKKSQPHHGLGGSFCSVLSPLPVSPPPTQHLATATLSCSIPFLCPSPYPTRAATNPGAIGLFLTALSGPGKPRPLPPDISSLNRKLQGLSRRRLCIPLRGSE
ncbi:unnamed protein product [Lepidochelys olivacea]